jgi:hypothetical protein
VADMKQRISKTGGETPERRLWEPMSLKRIGTFAELLTGSVGDLGDGGTKRGPGHS